MSGSITALVRTLVAAGATPELILAAVETAEATKDAALEGSREKARARFHKWKANQPANVSKRSQTLANDSKQLAGGEDSSSKKDITGKEEKKESAAKPRGDADFRSELSSILDPERIEALCAVRRKKGATFSAHAGRLLSKALLACPSAAEAADEMVLRNWTGIKPEWLESRTQRATSPPNRRPNAVDANIARRIKRNEPTSGRRDYRDAELLPPDKPELRALVGNLGEALTWGDG